MYWEKKKIICICDGAEGGNDLCNGVCFQDASTRVVMTVVLDVKHQWVVGSSAGVEKAQMSLESLVPTVRNCFKKNDRALLKGHRDQLERVPSDQINWRQVKPENKG